MTNTVSTTLARQSGLMTEMQVIANNIANLSTTGFRGERVMFSEYVRALGGEEPALSMAAARARVIDQTQGMLQKTGGSFDMAIEGQGYFLVDTPDGQRLTRAGQFAPNANGTLVTPDGMPLLDSGQTPIQIPPEAERITIAEDGTLTADGVALAQVGLFQPADGTGLSYGSAARFASSAGIEPLQEDADGRIPGRIHQGFVEASNVNPISEVARMISVQRAYELGQGFQDKEDQRLRDMIQSTLK